MGKLVALVDGCTPGQGQFAQEAIAETGLPNAVVAAMGAHAPSA
jgi:hypothetical protein